MADKLGKLDIAFARLRDTDAVFTSALLRQHGAKYAETNARYRPEMDNEETRAHRERFRQETKLVNSILEDQK